MPYVLPQPEARRRWYNDVGESQGLTARLLLAILSGGGTGVPGISQSPTTPTTGNPGSITFPSGAKTSTSPLEQAMIQQMGGAPSRQGGTVPVTYQPPMKWGLSPNVDQQLKQAQLAQAQAQAGWYNRLPGSSASGSPASTNIYQVGDILERNGKRARITGFDADGTPLVEPL